MTLTERLYSLPHAFDNRVVIVVTCTVAALLLLSGIATAIIRKSSASDKLKTDLTQRTRSWLILAPMMIVPILLGQIPTIIAVMLLSLVAHREFARATGLFRFCITSAGVVLGIFVITWANLDNWYRLFAATVPMAMVILAALNVLQDKPDGYLQRVALGILSFGLFGSALGHLGLLANDSNFRAILLWLIFCVQVNDVFAYVCGKTFGRRKLLPVTSPGKTIGGSVGALALTTLASALISPYVFSGTPLATWPHGLAMGIMISVLGQLGDLVISSVKRDVGIKDMGNLFPGHGGLLDRFDSLVLAAPAVFHYVNYFIGIANGTPVRIFTGGH